MRTSLEVSDRTSISDYRLPNENGLTVLARLRDTLRLETPAILMSGDTSLRHIEAQNVPNVLVVQKPFDADDLLALIFDTVVIGIGGNGRIEPNAVRGQQIGNA